MLASDIEFLQHILEETNFVLSTVKWKDKNEVLLDGTLFRAIIRSLEIIGEATKKLSVDFKDKYPEIEWKKMARTRDVLIHVYFAIDNDIIWNIIDEKLPPLQIFVSTLIIP